MKGQDSSGMNQKSVQADPMLGHFSKSDVRYWHGAVFRQSYTRNGRSFLTKAWAMKVAHEGRRETFPLGTPNRAAAAARARDIYLFLAANGWEAAVARYKKTKRIVEERNAERGVTVGVFLDAVFTVSTNRSTVEGYAIAFRKIVADLFGFSNDLSKFDYQSGGRDEWLAKVHGVELGKITPARIQEWKQSFLAAAGDDPLALRKARISVNTFLRRSRSLFSPRLLRQVQLKLPSPLPFDGVEFEPRQSMKYRSDFNVLDLISWQTKSLDPRILRHT
jgi:hypothetical protein